MLWSCIGLYSEFGTLSVHVLPVMKIVTKMLSLCVCDRHNIPSPFPPHILIISPLDLFKLKTKILMQHNPYYDTCKVYITYILNISAHMFNSEFVI